MIGAGKFGFMKQVVASGPLVGKLFGIAGNQSGQLGLGDTSTPRSTPVQVGSATDWAELAGYDSNSLVIRSGKLFGMGNNAWGQLGLGHTTSPNSPAPVGSETDWIKVALGLYGGYGIRGSSGMGKLYSMGYNGAGQLGEGGYTRSSPVQVGSATDWTQITASEASAMGIRGGALFGAGGNSYGELGMSGQKLTFTQVGSFTDWTWVSMKHYATAAIRGGKLYTTGYNPYGQLGTGNNASRNSFAQVGSETDWTQVDSAGLYMVGIRGGKLFSWGYHAGYRLGIPTSQSSINSPVQVGSATDWIWITAGDSAAYGIRGSSGKGALYSWGVSGPDCGVGPSSGLYSQPIQVGSAVDWIRAIRSFVLAYGHTLAIKAS